jgi:ATP-binding protein involved in chromosome partitioning
MVKEPLIRLQISLPRQRAPRTKLVGARRRDRDVKQSFRISQISDISDLGFRDSFGRRPWGFGSGHRTSPQTERPGDLATWRFTVCLAWGRLYSDTIMPTEDDIRNALKAVKYPGYSRDIVSFGLLKHVAVNQGAVSVSMSLTSANPEAARQLKTESERILKGLPGVNSVFVEVNQPQTAPGAAPAAGANPWSQQAKLPGLSRIVAIASGKGGVGKSTVSVNLACGLQHLGLKVGLLDCDIYGPSVPLMMGVHDKPTISAEEKMVPPVGHGVKVMSMGLLLDGDQPVIWRGPMIVKTIQQFFQAVEWGTLDYLLVDLPPGTGDAQLTLCQTVPLDGGVIVTTPQEASLGVVRKGIAMFQKVNVPILGIVENMSYYTTPTGDRVEIFGHGGGHAEAKRQNVSFLGEVPIFTEIREAGDRGVPLVVSAPTQPPGAAFISIAKGLVEKFT